MSKQLITADYIRDIKAKGQTEIEVSLTNCIVTPEAREVAEQLGVSIVTKGCNKPANKPATDKASPKKSASSLSEAELKVIRQAIVEQLPKGAMISDALIDQLVCKAIQENKHAASAPSASQKPSGIKLVKGNTAKLEIFEGAGIEKQVGIADMIGAADNSNMAAGYMAWENAFFPWTLNYDEINIVLEGELHICHQDEVKIAKAGDMIFIPKGSSIQFGTPSKVRFVYVSWPANWQDQ